VLLFKSPFLDSFRFADHRRDREIGWSSLHRKSVSRRLGEEEYCKKHRVIRSDSARAGADGRSPGVPR
jgi:hypothetical protein